MSGKSEMEKLRALEIDGTKIDEALSKQAAYFLFVAEKSIEAEARYLAYKMKHEEQMARIDGKIRSDFEKAGKKATESVVSNAILLNEDYQKSAANLNILRTQKEILKALKEAWYMRKDLLIRMAINQRAEIEGLSSETVKE